MNLFLRVIEADIEELLELRHHPDLTGVLQAYSQILLAFLQSDLTALDRAVNSLAARTELRSVEDYPIVYGLGCLRIRIRTRRLDEEILAEVLSFENNGQWRGEIYFCVAMAYAALRNNVRAQEFYRKAITALERIGAKRKALKALANTVSAESRIHPDKKLISDYQHVYRKARKLREFSVAGQALVNISREFQKVGAHLAALKCVNRAFTLLQTNVDSLPYHLAIVHRCHVLLELGREKEAKIDYDFARSSNFAEIRAALKVIDLLRGGRQSPPTLEPAEAATIEETWKERLQAGVQDRPDRKRSSRLGEMEDALIRYLAERPRTKMEIIQYFYSSRFSIEVAENRFKSLLNRVKKKRPGLIVHKGGKYSISDEIFLEIQKTG